MTSERLSIKSSKIIDSYYKCLAKHNGFVDIEWISNEAKSEKHITLDVLRNNNLIFRNSEKWDGDEFSGFESSSEYLSGNLYTKLLLAKDANGAYNHCFDREVAALENALPASLSGDEIYVSLASPWIPEDIVLDFINHIIQPKNYMKCKRIVHDAEIGAWFIPDKNRYSAYVRNNTTYGTYRLSAIHIIEKTLNGVTISVTYQERNKRRLGYSTRVDQSETAVALEKQRLIEEEFRDWVWKDEDRSRRLKDIYYETYACLNPREYDGRYLEFPEMSKSIELYDYQKNAIARILQSSNTLLAHEVGTGKTYIMIASAMKLRQMGVSKKPMIVVPNNIVGQWAEMIETLYPSANALVVLPRDFTKDKKQATLAMIRDGDYDAILIPYSCFDRITLSKLYYTKIIAREQSKVWDAWFKKTSRTPQYEHLAKKMDKLAKSVVIDKGAETEICFDQLGIDRLFLDEAHNYKNLKLETNIKGVYGISNTGSKKCEMMLDKVRYVQEINNGSGVVMATATPITNSISDIYVFMKYLMREQLLEELELQTFDKWIGTFAEKRTEFEVAVDTVSYRLATRFSRFHNIPELTKILATMIDYHKLDSTEGLPVFEGYRDIFIPRSNVQREYYENISVRADRVHKGLVPRHEDNMLLITGDGRKAGLDIRLVCPNEPGDGRTKVSECAERVALIYFRTKTEKLTQLVFCDISTPKNEFNVYDELKGRLVDFGVKEEEIAFIHDANNERMRNVLFEKVRKGEVRVLIGSTFKLGQGVNIQDKLIALHHLDVPWRPADMTQREGRIIRKGNTNTEIEIYRYIVEKSFDAYSWQILETKQTFINNILSGTLSGRSGDEIENTVLNYAEVKALALGNELLKKRVMISIEISRLETLKHKNNASRKELEERYFELPSLIKDRAEEYDRCSADAAFVRITKNAVETDAAKEGKSELAKSRRKLREAVSKSILRNFRKSSERELTSYRGFKIILPAHMYEDSMYVWLEREGRYRVNLGEKEGGIVARIDNVIDGLAKHTNSVGRKLDLLRNEQYDIKEELAKSDTVEERLRQCRNDLAEIDKQLGMDVEP